MDKSQAAQLGLAEGTGPVQTGQLDPTQVTAAPQEGVAITEYTGIPKSGIAQPIIKMANSLMKKAAQVSKTNLPTNPKQQKQMFGTVHAETKSNPTTDIINKDPNAWKNLQRKFGIKEV